MGNKLSLAKLPFAKPFTSLENVTRRLSLSFTEPDYEPETVANILRVLNDGPDQADYYTENIILLEVVGYYNCFIALTRDIKPLERAINMGSTVCTGLLSQCHCTGVPRNSKLTPGEREFNVNGTVKSQLLVQGGCKQSPTNHPEGVRLMDFRSSIGVYDKSTPHGTNAMATLGLYYVQNKETYEKGIATLMQAVERGHPFAMHNIVMVYCAKLEYDRFCNEIRGIIKQSADTEPATEDPVINFINEHLDLLDIVPTGKTVSSTSYIAKAVYYKVICKDMAKYNECIEAGVAHNSMQCKLVFARNCLDAKDEAQFMSIAKELIDTGYIPAMFDMGDYYIRKNDEQKALEYLKMIWDIDPYYNLRTICGCDSCIKMRLHNNGMIVSYHNKLINIPKLLGITPDRLVQLCVNAGHEYLANHTPGTLALYNRLTDKEHVIDNVLEPDNTICPD